LGADLNFKNSKYFQNFENTNLVLKKCVCEKDKIFSVYFAPLIKKIFELYDNAVRARFVLNFLVALSLISWPSVLMSW